MQGDTRMQGDTQMQGDTPLVPVPSPVPTRAPETTRIDRELGEARRGLLHTMRLVTLAQQASRESGYAGAALVYEQELWQVAAAQLERFRRHLDAAEPRT